MIPFDQNNNPNARYKNSTLRTFGTIQFIVVGVIGAVVGAVSYVFLTNHNPVGELSILFGVLGAIVALTTWRHLYFQYARKHRADFITAGGDPTGMTLFMFGAMGGKLLEDGTWEWDSFDGSSGDGGNSVGGGDGGGGD